MVRFMKGMVQSLRWMHNNKDATVEFLAKEIQLKPALALKGWEYYTQNRIWPYYGEPNIEGMNTTSAPITNRPAPRRRCRMSSNLSR